MSTPGATTSTRALAYTTAAVAVLSLAMLYCNRSRRKQTKSEKERKNQPPDPDAWTYLGTVQAINIYPFKSGAGIALSQGNFDKRGVSWLDVYDRSLVLLNEDGEILYAGQHPNMLNVRSQLFPLGSVQLNAPDMAPLVVNLDDIYSLDNRVPKSSLKSPFPVPLLLCRPAHHTWCSRVVLKRESGLRLCLAVYNRSRLASATGNVSRWLRHKKERVLPISALHDKSLNDLNCRLSVQNQASAEQFRANLIIESRNNVTPYDEDRWQWLRIGDDPNNCTILRYNSECQRCILVNVNADTCLRNPAGEPLRTLKRYRLRHSSDDPAMGIYLDVFSTGPGPVNRGDPVYVQYN